MNHAKGLLDGNAHSLCRRLAAAALVGLSLTAGGPALAERVSKSEYQAFRDILTGATKHTVGLSSNGVPLATRGVPGPTQVGNTNFGHAAGAWPTANATVDIPSPISGKPLTATAKQGFSKASQAAALGRFAAKVITPIAVGAALYDLIQELGQPGDWELQVTGDGANKFWRTTSGTMCTSGCFEFRNTNDPSSPWVKSRDTAAAAHIAYHNANPAQPYSMTFQSWTSDVQFAATMCRKSDGGGCLTSYATLAKQSTPPYDTRTRSEVSEADFAAELAAQSGWPSTSAIDRALADMANSGLVDLQNALDTENAAAITAAQTKVTSDPKTETLSDGTTKTTTTTCEWVQGIPPGPLEWRCWDNTTTVAPQKTSTETVVKTNPDGTTSTETITKTTPSTTVTGTTTASASELDEKLCPDGSRRLVCSELDVPTGEAIPRVSKTITYTPESVLSTGSCPANKTMSIGGQLVTVWNWEQACDYIVAYVKPLFLAVAAFVALIIVMPGGASVRGVET